MNLLAVNFEYATTKLRNSIKQRLNFLMPKVD